MLNTSILGGRGRDSRILQSFPPSAWAWKLLSCSSAHPPGKQWPAAQGVTHRRRLHALLGLAMAFGNDLGQIGLFFCVMVSSPTFLSERNDEALSQERSDSAVYGRNITECQELCVPLDKISDPSQCPEHIPVGPGGRNPSTVIPSRLHFNVGINGMKGFSQAEALLTNHSSFTPGHTNAALHPPELSNKNVT